MKLELTCWSCGATLESRPVTLEVEEPVLALRVVGCQCHSQTIRYLMDEKAKLRNKLDDLIDKWNRKIKPDF